eukprot:CAMPEP_0182559146 /NCGR_PEP_ID=MMETSP1324-20130603/2383_1 /TAXON_ID=236786 /ORGANISM="Florenciella sp., Strain RCC1587" /LENGTH=172 /DNA_ID=CAMNT_0024771377 /DNA_START=206 /DNA_END=724 /DNA_ORIENTATION=-
MAQPVGGKGYGPAGCDTHDGMGEAMLQPKSVSKPAAGCDTAAVDDALSFSVSSWSRHPLMAVAAANECDSREKRRKERRRGSPLDTDAPRQGAAASDHDDVHDEAASRTIPPMYLRGASDTADVATSWVEIQGRTEGDGDPSTARHPLPHENLYVCARGAIVLHITKRGRRR